VALLLILLAAPFVIGATAGPGERDATEVFRFADPAIVESSGLVVDDGLFVTTNDSGDRGRVFTVDDTGRTVGVTSWSDDPTDVEALAPAGPGEVWVGDIGDNAGARSSVSVTKVPVGAGDRTVDVPSYDLVYPDGARDAEALLVNPVTGRLYIASKIVFGGTLYEAPAELDPDADNLLRAVGDVGGIVTDGGFFPDGRHVVLRDYSNATVYTFPGLAPVGDLDLPGQRQGEGLAVDGDQLYVSTEGLRTTVHRVGLSERLEQAMSLASTTVPEPTAEPAPRVRIPPAEDPSQASREFVAWRWLVGIGLGLIITITLLRALRPR
jgi:hypothetical protein